MIEIPEAIVLSKQINETLKGKKVEDAIANQSPHKFAWFFGEPCQYIHRLMGKTIENADAFGGHVEVSFGKTKLVFSEGVALRYFIKGEKQPEKHQLLIAFEDESVLTASVQMYGGLCCFEEGEYDNIYYKVAKEKPNPLSNDFSFEYFQQIVSDENIQNKSVKALLATEQRIPGLGNGVLQDILINAKIHPKRKVETLTHQEIQQIYDSIKKTLHEMTINGGRDTEKDLFRDPGEYKTILSSKTVKEPCSICGGNLVKKAFLGGSIYYCEACQPEK